MQLPSPIVQAPPTWTQLVHRLPNERGWDQVSHDDWSKPLSLKLTTSRTIVSPSRRITSIPIGLGAGFAMAPKMAIEAIMKEVVCIMNDLIVLDDRPELYMIVLRCSCIDCRCDCCDCCRRWLLSKVISQELAGKDVSFIFINWLTRDLPHALFLLRRTPVSSFSTSLPSSLTN